MNHDDDTPDATELADEALQSLADAAEAHALKAANEFTAGANPSKAQKLYEKWRVAREAAKVTNGEGMLAIAALVADFIQGEECPHCRRLQAAWTFALAHSLIEGDTEEDQRVN